MALSISCCLNLPPPQSHTTSTSESLHSKTSHLAWPKSQRQRAWRSRRLILGVATIIGGLEMINLEGISEQQMALAWDLHQQTVASKPVMQVQRWSDKRTCPPWRVNSLETIVPENLPRPFAHRRSEAVAFPDASSQSSSQIPTKIVTVSKGCFSL